MCECPRGFLTSMNDFEALNSRIIECEGCPRLLEWCRHVAAEKRRSFAQEAYWGKPVPNFGDPKALRLIVGLAPAAHGANRTGRMFTGDRSGDWLYRALHKAGVANQPHSTSTDDGLRLSGVMITAVAHCAPPANKPLPEEISTCRVHFGATFHLRPWKSILCLGGIAWTETWRTVAERAPVKFGHGVICTSTKGLQIVGCYHPSQQNTFTGRLTEAMLDDAIAKFLA